MAERISVAPVTVTKRWGWQWEHIKVSILCIYVDRCKFWRVGSKEEEGCLLLQAINTSWSCIFTRDHVSQVQHRLQTLPLLAASLPPMVHVRSVTRPMNLTHLSTFSLGNNGLWLHQKNGEFKAEEAQSWSLRVGGFSLFYEAQILNLWYSVDHWGQQLVAVQKGLGIYLDIENIQSFIRQTWKNALRRDLSPSHVSGRKPNMKQ